MMRLFNIFALMFVFTMVAFAGDQDFTLVNETGLTIDQFFCSPTTTKDWEDDVLGQDILADEASVEIKFSRDTQECTWDLMIVDADGDKIYWTGINLCEAAKITLHYEKGKPTATIEQAEQTEHTASTGEQDFTLVNQTGLTIDQFFCSPTTTNDWEEDVLGQDTLADDASVEIKFSRDTQECKWDLMIVDADDDKIYWTGINLCEAAKITLHYENGKPTATIENVNQ
jgi:hypothetical protein